MESLAHMKDAIDFIEENLLNDIEVTELARRACSSTFHFQRMFHILTGFTVAEYIRKRRLTLAAQELSSSNIKVLDVSLKYGYDSPESFSKAFRKTHGISPSQARDEGVMLKAFPRISFHLSMKGDKEMDYRIVKRDAFFVVGKERRVPATDGEDSKEIPKFWQDAYSDGTVTHISALSPGQDLLGICMDMDLEHEQLSYVIAVELGVNETSKTDFIQRGFSVKQIPAATWAVFTSVGPLPQAIQAVWRRIFEEWFPATGYEHVEGPELEILPLGDDCAPDYRSEVWIPVKKKA